MLLAQKKIFLRDALRSSDKSFVFTNEGGGLGRGSTYREPRRRQDAQYKGGTIFKKKEPSRHRKNHHQATKTRDLVKLSYNV